MAADVWRRRQQLGELSLSPLPHYLRHSTDPQETILAISGGQLYDGNSLRTQYGVERSSEEVEHGLT
jgi:hypothetical protein